MRKDDDESNAVSEEYKIDRVDVLETTVPEPKTFKVEGTLHLKDAELLESFCREFSDRSGHSLTIELSDLCFLDHASAEVLCRMRRQRGIKIRGMNLFIKKIMELTNDSDNEH